MKDRIFEIGLDKYGNLPRIPPKTKVGYSPEPKDKFKLEENLIPPNKDPFLGKMARFTAKIH